MSMRRSSARPDTACWLVPCLFAALDQSMCEDFRLIAGPRYKMAARARTVAVGDLYGDGLTGIVITIELVGVSVLHAQPSGGFVDEVLHYPPDACGPMTRRRGIRGIVTHQRRCSMSNESCLLVVRRSRGSSAEEESAPRLRSM